MSSPASSSSPALPFDSTLSNATSQASVVRSPIPTILACSLLVIIILVAWGFSRIPSDFRHPKAKNTSGSLLPTIQSQRRTPNFVPSSFNPSLVLPVSLEPLSVTRSNQSTLANSKKVSRGTEDECVAVRTTVKIPWTINRILAFLRLARKHERIDDVEAQLTTNVTDVSISAQSLTEPIKVSIPEIIVTSSSDDSIQTTSSALETTNIDIIKSCPIGGGLEVPSSATPPYIPIPRIRITRPPFEVQPPKAGFGIRVRGAHITKGDFLKVPPFKGCPPIAPDLPRPPRPNSPTFSTVPLARHHDPSDVQCWNFCRDQYFAARRPPPAPVTLKKKQGSKLKTPKKVLRSMTNIVTGRRRLNSKEVAKRKSGLLTKENGRSTTKLKGVPRRPPRPAGSLLY